VWGVPGYTLKGIERELSKHRLTGLQAELYLIRLRQAVSDREKATQQEKDEVVERWKVLQRQRDDRGGEAAAVLKTGMGWRQ
jgi:sterol 3beta-glucosyltransferase